MSKKILVTGGTGYIGSHTVVELLNAGHEVEILDNLFNSKIEVLDKIEQLTGTKPKFHQVDLLDYAGLKSVFTSVQFDSVIHFAGLKAVGESVEKPLEYYENNVGGTINLLKCMRETNVKQIIFSSSATVYGVQDSPEYVETMTTGGQLSNPYGRTKYFIEEILKDTCVADPEFEAALLRYFNPIGADPQTRTILPHKAGSNILEMLVKAMEGKTKGFTIMGEDWDTRDGTCVRDYIHVADLAMANVMAVKNFDSAFSNAGPQYTNYLSLNIGSGVDVTVREFIIAFENVTGERINVYTGKRRKGDIGGSYAGIRLAKKAIGWSPKYTVEDAIFDVLKYYDI